MFKTTPGGRCNHSELVGVLSRVDYTAILSELRKKYLSLIKFFMKINKRTFSFFKTDISLTSKRVSIILNNSEDSFKLADSVRKGRRKNEPFSFTVTTETTKLIRNSSSKKLKLG